MPYVGGVPVDDWDALLREHGALEAVTDAARRVIAEHRMNPWRCADCGVEHLPEDPHPSLDALADALDALNSPKESSR